MCELQIRLESVPPGATAEFVQPCFLFPGGRSRLPVSGGFETNKAIAQKQATALVKRLAALYAPPSMRIQVVTFHLTTEDFLPKVNSFGLVTALATRRVGKRATNPTRKRGFFPSRSQALLEGVREFRVRR